VGGEREDGALGQGPIQEAHPEQPTLRGVQLHRRFQHEAVLAHVHEPDAEVLALQLHRVLVQVGIEEEGGEGARRQAQGVHRLGSVHREDDTPVHPLPGSGSRLGRRQRPREGQAHQDGSTRR
jgi:hypothetical protein